MSDNQTFSENIFKKWAEMRVRPKARAEWLLSFPDELDREQIEQLLASAGVEEWEYRFIDE